LPARIESVEQVVASIFSAATQRTRLLIVSHVTSPTAIVLPVREICAEARRRGIAVCIDGPHAPAQVPLALDELACDFYTASLHKWLSAPLGAGFLYVAPAWQPQIQTPQLSWGRIAPREPAQWWDEFVWPGTRDPSAYLASTAAVDFLQQVGLPTFRARTHYLAATARRQITGLTGLDSGLPDSPQWYGSMVTVPLPPGDRGALQQALWEDHRIEVPIIEHDSGRWIRVSCHLYTGVDQLDHLLASLRAELGK
jgi:isopenicillin-N epimerase